MPFAATWMDLEIIILNEVSQTEKGKYMIWLICGVLKRKLYKWTYLNKKKQIHKLREQTFYQRKELGEGID